VNTGRIPALPPRARLDSPLALLGLAGLYTLAFLALLQASNGLW